VSEIRPHATTFIYLGTGSTSRWATWIGAARGALPALMGWTRRIEIAGLTVFGVRFFWQSRTFTRSRCTASATTTPPA